ncbi:cytochrome o ubiquinol oxidase protein CyoD [Pandoraea thiooxydans]|uniref:Cytochrome bo(3) ubiquinol oxidase subunit 4 n=1 Tax=Pandoraea thiooxydans TaxID=445709 RepID=A0A0G3EQE5_9BURK|nr:cytochrome o ubiquinol oxidase subunit IV [Pandoraea thiooxydans]AKJ66876.1 cytochrome o ubiquinol oxidase subunit IV [Pandoraea thiooxydans]APR93753.1 cytochrome o ubiquinol oxidase protein CyoD [Pandoraea thiooxydans]
MSAHDTALGDAGAHDHDEDEELPHSTFSGYMTGFVLAVALTALPFWIVMGSVFHRSGVTAAAILLIGAVQIVVHMIYFLHMDGKVQGGWSLLALIFTIVLVAIALSGSIWVMYHLNENMMPGMMQPMHNPP